MRSFCDTCTSSVSARNSGRDTITYDLFLFLLIPPSIVAEWISLIPLIAYLASYRHDHQLAEEAALSDRLNVSLFSRLRILDGIVKLLTKGSEFLDRVSAMSEVSHQMWNVNWDNAFPCANGAASSIITAYAPQPSRLKLCQDVKTSVDIFQTSKFRKDCRCDFWIIICLQKWRVWYRGR